MIGQDLFPYGAEELGWVVLAVLAGMVGIFAGLIGLVSGAIRGSRVPVAGALVVICGVVFIICTVAAGRVSGVISIGEWLWGAVWGGLLIAAGLSLSFLKNRPPDSAQPLPDTCGESTPQGRRCRLPPRHEGPHRYVTSTRRHRPSKERAATPSS